MACNTRIFAFSSRRFMQHFFCHGSHVSLANSQCVRPQKHNIGSHWQSTRLQSTSTSPSGGRRQTRIQPFGPQADAPGMEQIRMEKLFKNSDTVLLFRAGSKKVFNFFSILLGTTLIGGGVMTGNVLSTLSETGPGLKLPLLLVVPQFVSIGFFIVMGVVILWTPFRTLKSVTAIANRGGPKKAVMPVLQCQPYWPGKKFEIAPIDARIETKVAMIDASDIHSIPLAKAQAFTKQYSSPSASQTKVEDTLSGVNKGMVDIFPAIKTAIKSMMLREGMVRMHLRGHGVWKLDLHGCQILDAGQPLKLLTTPDPNVGRNMMTSIRERAFGPASSK